MLCVEHLLQLSKFLVEPLRLSLFILIFSLESGSIVRVDIAQMNFMSWLDSVTASVKVLWQSETLFFRGEFLDVSQLMGHYASIRWKCLITPNR